MFVEIPFIAMCLFMTAVSPHRTCDLVMVVGSKSLRAAVESTWNVPKRYAIERPITGYAPSGEIILSCCSAYLEKRSCSFYKGRFRLCYVSA